jgi:hypothetical protein
VHDDGAVDRLAGKRGRDWYFAHLTDPFRDVLVDRIAIEAVEGI